MMKKVDQQIAKEKLIIDSATGKPVKEILLEEERLIIVKENGERIEIPSNTVRAKHIKMRVEHGISEITEAIYI